MGAAENAGPPTVDGDADDGKVDDVDPDDIDPDDVDGVGPKGDDAEGGGVGRAVGDDARAAGPGEEPALEPGLGADRDSASREVLPAAAPSVLGLAVLGLAVRGLAVLALPRLRLPVAPVLGPPERPPRAATPAA